MKKLIIASALVAATVANAELCVETGVAAGCSVYNVKFSLKTLAGKKSECGNILLANNGGVWTRYVGDANWGGVVPAGLAGAGVAAGTNVGDLTDAQKTAGNVLWTGAAYPGSIYDKELETRKAYWMDNVTRTWEGVLWQCESNCIDPAQIAAGSRAMFVMWEKKAKRAMSFPAFRAYNTPTAAGTPYRWFSVDYNCNFAPATALANEVPCFWFLGRYGQKATKVAVGWNPTVYPTYGFHAAGFGTFYSRDNVNRMTSVSGNCVGLIAPLVAGSEDDCGNETRIFSQIAYVCQTFKKWCCDPCYYGTDAVPASGTWSLKYNSTLSKGTKPLSSIIPSYAVFNNENYTAANIAALNAAVAAVALPAGGTAAFNAQGFLVKTPGAAPDTATFTDAELDLIAAAIAPAFVF